MEEKITYAEHILPILRQRCGSCHNANDKRGGLVVDQYASLMEGGSSGTSVEPGDAGSSYLWSLVNHESEPRMPPNADKLPENELALLRKWIDLGALENSGSKANIKKKATVAKVMVTGTRPAEVAFPTRYLGDPQVRTENLNAVTALAVSPWAPLVAVSGHRQVALYHAETLELLGTLPFPEGQPQVIKFSSAGDLLMVGGGRAGAQGVVVVFDVKTGERTIEVGAEYDAVLGADISPDQTLIALGGPKKMLRVYSTDTGELVYEQKKHTDWITAVAFSPDGVLLASADRANGVVVWEAETGRLFYDLQGHKAPVADIAWQPDSNVLASVSQDGKVMLWEMINGTNIKNWDAHGGGVESIRYTREGQIVTTGRDNVARLWNSDGNKVRDFGGLTDYGMEVAYEADTKRLFAGDLKGQVLVWNAEDGAVLGKINTNPPTLAILLEEAGQTLAAAQQELQQRASVIAGMQKQQADKLAAAEQVAKLAAEAAQVMAKAQASKGEMELAAKERQTSMAAAEEAMKQAEAALAAAKAAFEKAAAERNAQQKMLADAMTALNNAVAAEKAAAEAAANAKAAAEKAAAEAKPTEEQLKALQEAEAALQQAQAKAAAAQAKLERLQQAKPAE